MLSSSLPKCEDFLFEQLLENWHKYGIDKDQGFSYESLNHDLSRNRVGRIRLLTQCRQLYTFSHAVAVKNKKHWEASLQPLFEFIITHYFQDNRWIFSLDDELNVQDTQSDAYALAFVLLSFSHYYQVTKDARALSYITKTHRFLIDHMQADTGGFYEAYPINNSQIRRQNPHMHLLEGYIAAYETTQEEGYKTVINSLLELALSHFYDSKSKTLIEFFHHDWTVHNEIGHQIEPGHHFEWVWLLHQAYKIEANPEYLELAHHLWGTAIKHGLSEKGGIYNQISNLDYQVLDREKRIWPITEYLKAITVLPIGKEEKQHRIEVAFTFIKEYYFLDEGRWNEYLTEDNQAKDYPLPGTSTYHIFLGLTEVITWAKLNSQASKP
ncbi:AGE family epimerase/isomerase [Marinomonas sp. C2222]|uniref:AGE family epimerase/isomerase n=1 Tax=Marinomonas sargassi TaxID=2984494 RepID=A0ABT2YNG1_9GAMM|nr:AGE family epimerase/isomerase [Marinomonas sargassi]MCV2401423.1 AGE family epimerase/isomerase [Marinomonas sargassi]